MASRGLSRTSRGRLSAAWRSCWSCSNVRRARVSDKHQTKERFFYAKTFWKLAGSVHFRGLRVRATTPAAAGGLTTESSVDDILDALDRRGKELNDFTANVTLADTDTAVGNETKMV